MSDYSSHPSSPREPLTSKSNKLRLELAPFGLEKLHDYELGGHHPVHLGDLLGTDGRYRVIHKLGNGGFANIWLCRDFGVVRNSETSNTTKYVAVKVLMNEASSEDDCSELLGNNLLDLVRAQEDTSNDIQSVSLPLHHFTIGGPNGNHLCFVYPVLGPSLKSGLPHASEDPGTILRDISLKTTAAVKFLHSYNICHGDITPSNILLRVSGLDGLPEDELLQLLGNPVRNPVLAVSGELPNTAPKYLVYPIKWHNVDAKYIENEPCLIDFGEAFQVSSPPEDLGTPGPYRSPELILDNKIGMASDLWALGCTIFEIRTGRKLFNMFDDEDDAYLEAMVEILGKMPEPWWSSTWEKRKKIFQDEVDENGHAITATIPIDLMRTAEREEEEQRIITSTVHPSVVEGAQSLLEKLAPGLWYLPSDRGQKTRHWDISEQEKELFADFLGQVFKYDPKNRLCASDMADHPWFKL